jgi:hypothetical protein
VKTTTTRKTLPLRSDGRTIFLAVLPCRKAKRVRGVVVHCFQRFRVLRGNKTVCLNGHVTTGKWAKLCWPPRRRQAARNGAAKRG